MNDFDYFDYDAHDKFYDDISYLDKEKEDEEEDEEELDMSDSNLMLDSRRI